MLGAGGFSAHLRNFLQVLDLHIFRQKQPGHWGRGCLPFSPTFIYLLCLPNGNENFNLLIITLNHMNNFEITKSELFKHPKFGNLRVLTDENGDPWFVGKVVAEALG